MVDNNFPIILIATKNLDKFRIVMDILKGIGLRTYSYVSLVDLQIEDEMEESGTIEDRARQKVIFYKEILKNKNLLTDIVAIIGVDDGIYIKKEGYHTAESKEITDQILSGLRLQKGDEIVIRRSYFAYIANANEDFHCTTNVPFQFLGNPKGITRKDGKYPLSHVIGHLGGNTTVAENISESNIRYNITHSQELLPLLSILK